MRAISPEALLSDLSASLRTLPGATALYVFGSLARGRADLCSDVDLKLVSRDPAASLAARHTALRAVGEVELELPLIAASDHWAATILFRDLSPYQHLDLDIVSEGWDRIEGWALLWRQPPAASCPRAEPAPYIPAPGTAAHLVVSQLLGGVRYAKARRRGHALTCWRFAQSAANAVAVALRDRAVGRETLGEPLSTIEWVELDEALSEEERGCYLSCLDFATPGSMDRSLCALLGWLCELSGASLPPEVAEKLLRFVRSDLGLLPIPDPGE